MFVFVIAGWVVSLCLHEFGHAFTAWRFGDRDVALRGYLDLDPRRYSHPVLSIVLPIAITAIGGIGLPGAAVYVRTSSMTAKQRTLVSLAGPAANLLLAVLLLGADQAVLRPDAPGAVGRGGVLGLPADHRVAAEPAADPRPGRVQRAGAAPEPGDPAGAGTVQAVRNACTITASVFPLQSSPSRYLARRRYGGFVPPKAGLGGWVPRNKGGLGGWVPPETRGVWGMGPPRK